eukprot:GCRY01002767.1.p1 GENE.GCRY01002767.1~~GCRY01002767.1.p1  ORF type:complete len:966 (-),score=355.98 GCRY01002767.1:57-2954(-)
MASIHRELGELESAPTGYVAGLGRGARGFTTQMDIGNARMSTAGGAGGAGGQVPPLGGGAGGQRKSPFGVPPPGYVAGVGRGLGGGSLHILSEGAGLDGGGRGERYPGEWKRKGQNDEDDEDNKDVSTFDGAVGLFSTTNYDKEDEEADAVWAAVDESMDLRRRKRREKREAEEIVKKSKVGEDEPAQLKNQFADLKRGLTQVSYDDWVNLPEGGDFSYKKQKQERYVPAPDSLLERARMENDTVSSIDAVDGAQSTVAGSRKLTEIGEAREQVMKVNLDKASDSVTGQTVVDPKGYMTDLRSKKLATEAEISDIKKARLLLNSVTTTNKKHGPGWIAAARLEEGAGHLASARKIINEGCAACPHSEDVWLEASRLQSGPNAKSVLAEAVRHLPHSVKIWIQAAALEREDQSKRRVLRRALEFIPNSVRLWKAAVSLESEDNAKIMLARAVECVPQSVDMWLALARLETYQNARKVLNKARETIPTEPSIWITAAKLEEANENGAMVEKIIQRAIKSLAAHQVTLDRAQWLREADKAEKSGSVLTCRAIVAATVNLGVEEIDRKHVWLADAQACMKQGSIETARAIFAHALSVFPTKKSIWLAAAKFEKSHGSSDSLEEILQKAVKFCPQAEVLWLMGAKERWVNGDVPGARTILGQAFSANPNSEQIWLAAVKLEKENNEIGRARKLLERACERAGTARVWMKRALLEREEGNAEEEERLLRAAIGQYPTFPKLFMMLGQLCARQKKYDAAREVYRQGIRHNPSTVELWLCVAHLEESLSALNKARSILERARQMVPASPVLWSAAIDIELRAGNKAPADTLLAKALQECKKSGLLWAKVIALAPRTKRTTRSVDALKEVDNDPLVMVAVARVFWAERKVDKARRWFERAVKMNPDLGDSWAFLYKFESQHGSAKRAEDVEKRCLEAEPRHGEQWITVSKTLGNHALSTKDILHRVVSNLPEAI